MANKSLGEWGERVASGFLRRRKYQILEKNFSSPLGEIDIIGKKGGTICFIEVKTRSSSDYGPPEMAITQQKQNKLRKVALGYLKMKKREENCRFDVVSILTNARGDAEKIELIEDAF
jgi:putative endonuclease